MFGGKKKTEEVKTTKAKNFKKEGGMSINEFILDSVNVPQEMRDIAKDIVKETFKNAGIKSKHLKDPVFKQQAGELIRKQIMHKAGQEDEEESKGSSVPPPPPGPVPPPPVPIASSDERISNIQVVKPSTGNSSGVPPPPPPPPAPGIGKAPPPPPPKFELKKVEVKSVELKHK